MIFFFATILTLLEASIPTAFCASNKKIWWRNIFYPHSHLFVLNMEEPTNGSAAVAAAPCYNCFIHL
jgi:hypothetical protein